MERKGQVRIFQSRKTEQTAVFKRKEGKNKAVHCLETDPAFLTHGRRAQGQSLQGRECARVWVCGGLDPTPQETQRLPCRSTQEGGRLAGSLMSPFLGRIEPKMILREETVS